MNMVNELMEKRIIEANEAITNALESPDILPVLTRFAYDEIRLNQGLDLYKEAFRLYHKRQREFGEQLRASEIYKTTLKDAKEKFWVIRQAAILALRKHEPLKKIAGIDTPPNRTLGGWMEDARQFYVNSLGTPKIVERLSRFGVTTADLEQGKQLVDEVEKAAVYHEKQKGKAQQATKERDRAYKKMREWMRDFRQVCRIAFVDNPQKLGKLGF